MNDERNGNGSSSPRRPENQPPRRHGADEIQGAPRRPSPPTPQHLVDGSQGGHRQGGNQPPRHQGTGETQGQHRQGGNQQGGNQPPRHPGNRDARPEQQGNQPRQGRPAPSPQGPRTPQPPRQEGGPPRSFTPQRRALHVPEVIVRHRFPSPAPAVETAIETAGGYAGKRENSGRSRLAAPTSPKSAVVKKKPSAHEIGQGAGLQRWRAARPLAANASISTRLLWSIFRMGAWTTARGSGGKDTGWDIGSDGGSAHRRRRRLPSRTYRARSHASFPTWRATSRYPALHRPTIGP